MCVYVCSCTSGDVKTCLCLEIPKETFPGRGTQFSMLLSCYHSPGTFLFSRPVRAVPDKPQAQLRGAHGADTIANRQSGCGHATHLKVYLEDTDHRMPAGLSSRARVQACAFSVIQPQSLSTLVRVTAKICDRRGNGYVQCPCCGSSFALQSQSNLWGGPASPVLSSPGASVTDLDCFIFKDNHRIIESFRLEKTLKIIKSNC